jgi:hypothetical protein
LAVIEIGTTDWLSYFEFVPQRAVRRKKREKRADHHFFPKKRGLSQFLLAGLCHVILSWPPHAKDNVRTLNFASSLSGGRLVYSQIYFSNTLPPEK